ncbi:MAG: ISAs1 family transposase [Bacilli bacterium]|nr:ISAs1 family transposase [Erysipelotrichaceae bacterium]MDY3801333.1 ISAs1 family transposase [Bacilli bacterium]
MNNGITLLKELNSSVSLLIQEKDISFDSFKRDIRFFLHLLDKIPDFRDKKLIDYSLSNLLLISLILIMKGEFKSFSYASQYISVYKQDFIKMGLIINDKVPSHDTLRRMFMLLDANSIKEIIINNLNSFLTKILNNYSSSKKELISIDGKEFKGSGRSINSKKKMNNKNVLNVYNSSKEICIYSNPLDDKESEIKEAQEILNKYNLKNIVVTGDALHCQKRTCEIIVNKKGDYVFTVKENQSALLEEMKTRIVNSKSIISKSYNDCDYSILLLPSTYKGLEFAGQKAFIKMISNKRKNQNINKQTERYFLSSIKDPQLIVEAIDNRWKIENDLHKTKDEFFVEDNYKFTDKNAIKVMAALNNIAYSFFRITASFLQEKTPTITKIKFNKDPMEILEKITPLLNSREFNKLLNDNLKGKKSK